MSDDNFKLTYDELPNENSLKINKNSLEIGIGLNKIDDLKPSKYFKNLIKNNNLTYEELESDLNKYHNNAKDNTREKECDIVSVRIAKIIDSTNSFKLGISALKRIHKELFEDVFLGELKEYVGVFRKVNITKSEDILNGKSVIYSDYRDIEEELKYDIDTQNKKTLDISNKEKTIEDIAKFISNIWETHPFREGNTRAITIFMISYLKKNGFDNLNNDIFKENSKYFRDALVLANFSDVKNSISADDSYLKNFLHKALFDKNIELKPMIVDKQKEFLDNAFTKLKPDLKSIKPNENAKDSVSNFINGLKEQVKDKGFER